MTQPRADARPLSVRSRVIDAAAIALSVLVAVIALVPEIETDRGSTAYLAAATALTVPGCAALWWRRRWPVGVAVLLAPMVVFTEFVGGAAVVAVFTVAVRRRRRVAAAVAALHCLAAVPYYLVRPDPDLSVPDLIILNVAIFGVILVWGARIRARRVLVDSLRARAVQAEADAEVHAERLRGQERERIASEMHDVLAHRISLVSVHAGALEVRSDLSAAEVAEAAGAIRVSAHKALEDLREILGVLRGGQEETGLAPQPGLADLKELVAEARSAGTEVTLEDRLPPAQAMPTSVARTAYRLLQEGLTNARKHAPGREVRLLLERTSGGELHVWMRNPLANEPAPTAIPGSRSGLVGLTERVDLLGGRIDHGARRGKDGGIAFHLQAWMPWAT